MSKKKSKRRQEKLAEKRYIAALEEQAVAQRLLDEAYRASMTAYREWVKS
jgi:hypothetical protein